MAKLPLNPARPERICWGCDRYCAADDLRCGNGTIRTQHPVEIFGRDWLEHGLDAELPPADSPGTGKSPMPRASDFDPEVRPVFDQFVQRSLAHRSGSA